MMNKKYLLGIFNDEKDLLNAIRNVRKESIEIDDVFTPFPVPGIEDAMGIKMTRIPVAAFIIGLCACIIALAVMAWMMGIDWPINYGGKPYIPWLSFIPITFEFTVLSAGIGMVAILLYACKLKPSSKQHPIDIRATDDKFILAINSDPGNKEKVQSLLKKNGATEIREQEERK